MRQKRIFIQWKNISPNLCEGTVTLDEWDKSQNVVAHRAKRSTTAEIYVSNGNVGMKNFSGKIFTEKIRETIFNMARHFSAGMNKHEQVFCWQDLRKD